MIGILIFIRSPWGQDIIVQKATRYVADRTGTEVTIDRFFITFSGNLYLENLYLSDEKGDTLLYSKNLETGVAVFPLIRNGDIHVSKFQWEGLRAHIARDSVTEAFNFDFLINAFVDDSKEVEDHVEEKNAENGGYPNIKIGPIDLTDFKFTYNDEVTGMDVSAAWDEVRLRIDQLDMEKMNFGIGEVYIDRPTISYIQSKPLLPSEDEPSEAPLPLLVLDKFRIENASILYDSKPDGILADILWKDFSLSLPEADLEAQKIRLEHLLLSEAIITLDMTTLPITEDEEDIAAELSQPFEWPEWIVEVGDITFERNQIAYTLDGKEPSAGVFDADAVRLSDFNFIAHGIVLKDQRAGFTIDEVSFEEVSGFAMRKFEGKVSLNSDQLNISNFLIETNSSELAMDLLMSYESLEEFIEDPSLATIDFSLKTLQTNASEALYFAPELRQEVYFRELMEKGLQMNGEVVGTIADITIPSLNLNYGKTTKATLRNARIRNAMDMDRLYYSIPTLALETTRSDIEVFVDDLAYDIPETITLNFNGEGSLEEFDGQINLDTSDGNMKLLASLQEDVIYTLNSTLILEELDLGKILRNPDLKPISLVLEANGSGSNLNDIEGKMILDVDQLAYADYDFRDLHFEVMAEDTMANLEMKFTEEFLDFDLNMTARLDTINPQASWFLDIRNLETQTLGLTAQDFNTRFKMEGNVSGSNDTLQSHIEIYDANIYSASRSYPIGKIEMDAFLSDSLTSFDIESEFLKGGFNANSSVDELTLAVNNYIDDLFYAESDSIIMTDVIAEANFTFYATPFIDQLLVEGIENMDTVYLNFAFRSAERELDAEITIDELAYTDAEINNFKFLVSGQERSIGLEARFDNLDYSPLNMGETSFTATLEGDDVRLGFYSKDDTSTVMQVYSELQLGDTITYHIVPDGLIFNRNAWEVPADNRIIYASEYIFFEEMSFSREGQVLNLIASEPDMEEEHVGVEFKDFRLSTFTGFLNPENPLVKGIANGRFIVENPFDAIGLLAGLSIAELEVIEIPLGTLRVDAEAKTLDEYDFNLSLKEGMIDMDLVGEFRSDSESSILDLDLTLNSLQMAMLAELSDDALRNGEGYISGRVKVDGTVQEPQYEGELLFHNASILVSDFNTTFNINEDKLRVDNDGLYLSNFQIQDINGNTFEIDGEIDTKDFADIGLDLSLKAQNFQVLNSTREDNDLFFGQANIDLDMRVQGSTDLPRINVTLGLNDDSEITVIIPEDQLEVVERDGVVLMVNHNDPYDIQNKRDAANYQTEGIQGYDVRANIRIDNQSIFNVIVDERTGDNLRLQGEADLNMLMNPNGNISLSGRYEIESGHYELSLYGLVNRRFELAQGSTVVWNGDPMSATLDLRAIYNVRTSATELMQSQLTGSDAETRNQFRQVLPFMVYLNIEGDLLRPEISFALDLAERERGAFGGSVYSQIQMVNEKEDEVIKQVFSLLVLNQFYPSTGSDGTGGGNVSIARSSVSQVLTSQLNALSDRFFGASGFSVDMDVDSYTDYRSERPQDRTQLNVQARQRLFDDRLVISVGGQVDVEGRDQEVSQGDALFGDVSIEYLLDSKGVWRAKAFRRNTFESVIDGQLIITGLSFIFNREFNAFKELFNTPPPPIDIFNREEEDEEDPDSEEENEQEVENRTGVN